MLKKKEGGGVFTGMRGMTVLLAATTATSSAAAKAMARMRLMSGTGMMLFAIVPAIPIGFCSGRGYIPTVCCLNVFGSACASASAAAARARPAADMLNAETSAADMLNTGMPAAETSDADMPIADMLSFSRKPAADLPESGRYARFAAVCIRHARLA